MNARTCIVTRTARPAEELIRFVADPDGVVVPDLKARLPGRGAWVTADAGHVGLAVRRRAFARALKQPVEVPDDLVGMVERLLERRALDALGLAAAAGQVVCGFTKTAQGAKAGSLALVLVASDAADDSRRKIAAACGDGLLMSEFTNEQMSLALGRPNVIHAGVAAGRAATSLEAAIARLARYREGAAGRADAT